MKMQKNTKERYIYTYERLLSNKNGGYEKELSLLNQAKGFFFDDSWQIIKK